jgi:hypothetical protein
MSDKELPSSFESIPFHGDGLPHHVPESRETEKPDRLSQLQGEITREERRFSRSKKNIEREGLLEGDFRELALRVLANGEGKLEGLKLAKTILTGKEPSQPTETANPTQPRRRQPNSPR